QCQVVFAGTALVGMAFQAYTAVRVGFQVVGMDYQGITRLCVQVPLVELEVEGGGATQFLFPLLRSGQSSTRACRIARRAAGVCTSRGSRRTFFLGGRASCHRYRQQCYKAKFENAVDLHKNSSCLLCVGEKDWRILIILFLSD